MKNDMKPAEQNKPDTDAMRHLDRAMTDAENAAFIGGLSEAERAELARSQRALQSLESLPQLSAPPDLANNVMAAIAGSDPVKSATPTARDARGRGWGMRSRLRAWLENRPLLGWGCAGAMVAAAALVIALSPPFFLFAPVTPSTHAASASANSSANSSVNFVPAVRLAAQSDRHSADSADSPHTLQFELYAPRARNVVLVGDFNGWGSMAEIKLSPAGNGVWRAALPLSAGRYQYAFVVDDERWVTDPHAERHVKDDFGRQNAIVTVI